MHIQHCSHWCPGAKTPGHQYPQCWLNIHWIDLTHWGRVMHICIGNLTNIGSDNGLSPGRRQSIIWSRDRSNAGILLMGLIGTNSSETWIRIQIFSLKKIRLIMSSAKYQSFCVSLNVLTNWRREKMATILQTMLLRTFCEWKHLKIPIKISLNFVPDGSINNIPALVQIMGWR